LARFRQRYSSAKRAALLAKNAEMPHGCLVDMAPSCARKLIDMRNSAPRASYRLGSLYALTTAMLLATQEPFSALAARRLSSATFICLTQFALLLSVPLLTFSEPSRRDFIALLSNARNLGKIAILFIAGVCGLLLYNIGLSSAHPIITAAILNMSPFWAALVALVISQKSIPVSPAVFFGCFIVAFFGAMIVAWSQVEASNGVLLKDLLESVFHSRWAFAIPMPIFFAISGTLVGKWFSEYDEGATIAANFVVSGVILIPTTLFISYLHPGSAPGADKMSAVLLLLLGTLAAAAAGRVFYQVALTTTNNDNGFVTMFFLLVPALSTVISIPLSGWIVELRFNAGPLFFLGLTMITIPLLVFLAKSWRTSVA
jgi:drug/metabolite transporter (DMT)-like permease